jgi:hypothetical protein
MATFTMHHDLDCDVDTFWRWFVDKDFNNTLFKALGFPKWEILEQNETDTQITRKVSGAPKMDAPAPVVKALGGGLAYIEDGTFDKKAKSWHFKMTPGTLKDKLRMEGTVKCEPRGEGKSKRVVEITAEAKIFGIGGMVESALEKSFRTGWADSAAFINKWVKEHP